VVRWGFALRQTAEVSAYVDTCPLRTIDTEDVVGGAVRYANGAAGAIDVTTVTFPGG